MSEVFAPDLTLLALLEGLATAQRVGAPLPLAAYAHAYPQHADALLAYAAALWSGDADAPEPAAPATPAALSAGTRRALARLFGDSADDADTAATPERLVAEQPGAYVTRADTAPVSPDGNGEAGDED